MNKFAKKQFVSITEQAFQTEEDALTASRDHLVEEKIKFIYAGTINEDHVDAYLFERKKFEYEYLKAMREVEIHMAEDGPCLTECYRDTARKLYGARLNKDDFEVYPDAPVRIGSTGGGAWVQAHVWVHEAEREDK